mgnify:FL=1
MKLIDLYRDIRSELVKINSCDEEAAAEAEFILLSKRFSSYTGDTLTRESLFGVKEQCEISEKGVTSARDIIKRRIEGIPLQYILNEAWFYGLNFQVYSSKTHKTFIPRPETEIIVEESLKFIKSCKASKINALDIGTGSGCIPITIIKNSNRKILWDAIDPFLTTIPHENAKNHILEDLIRFSKVELSKYHRNENKKYNLITANLPYVPNNSNIDSVVKHEPLEAIFGGEDGLDHIRETVKLIPKILQRSDSIAIFEIDPSQLTFFNALEEIYSIEIIQDINMLDRIVLLKFKN